MTRSTDPISKSSQSEISRLNNYYGGEEEKEVLRLRQVDSCDLVSCLYNFYPGKLSLPL